MRLLAAGLFLPKGVQQRFLDHPDPAGLVETAVRMGLTGLIDDDGFERLLAEAEGTETVDENDIASIKPILDASEGANQSASPVSTQPSEGRGRVVAPISERPIEQPARPHGLEHFSMDGFGVDAKEIDMELDIHFDITGNSRTEGKLDNILSCFNDRLHKMRSMLIKSGRLPNRPQDVAYVLQNKSRFDNSRNTATLVGLVNDVNFRGENLHFKVEDKSGEVFCILRPPRTMDGTPAGRRRVQIGSAGLMEDDVVGVTGFLSPQSNRDTFVVDDIHLAPMDKHVKRKAPVEHGVSAAFLSDLHLGSNTFLHAQWEKLVKWFHEDPLARTVKYLVLSGDVVDGVGIYKDQEHELEIVDLYQQYEGVARMIEQLPDWLETMILPGNHDAVRPAEPQPALDPRIQEYYNSTTFVGNPCDFSLHGVRVLSYHGVSIMDFVSSMRNVTFSQPEKAMAEMLERRHLAPTWGGKTPLSPELEDHMVIDTVPDIFVTGHVHGHYCGPHKGVTLIQSSTWQDQTSYQRMLGFQPKPCILTIVNLHTHETATIPFA